MHLYSSYNTESHAYSSYTHKSQCKQWIIILSCRWMQSWSKKELCIFTWHSRPVHWLGLMCKASFCLLPHSLVNPHLLPLRNSCNGERGFSKKCMSRWKGIADWLPLRKNHPIYTIVWHCGRGGHIGIGHCFVQAAGEVGRYLTPPHPAPAHTLAPKFPRLAERKVERKFKNLPSLYQPPVKGKLEIQTFTLPGINLATLLNKTYHYSKILWCTWNFSVVGFCQHTIIRKHQTVNLVKLTYLSHLELTRNIYILKEFELSRSIWHPRVVCCSPKCCCVGTLAVCSIQFSFLLPFLFPFNRWIFYHWLTSVWGVNCQQKWTEGFFFVQNSACYHGWTDVDFPPFL